MARFLLNWAPVQRASRVFRWRFRSTQQGETFPCVPLSLDTTRAQRVCNAQTARVSNPGSATCVRDGSGDLLLVTVFRRAARDRRVAIGESTRSMHDDLRYSPVISFYSEKKKKNVPFLDRCIVPAHYHCSVTQCRPIRAGCTSLWTGAAGSVITAAFADK